MKLDEYLTARGTGAVKELARKSGVLAATISRIRCANRPINLSLMAAMHIEMATDGEVLVEELMPQHSDLMIYFRRSKVQLCLDLR